MRPDSLIHWGASRALRALVLIATLFLGGTFHELHHAMDPHCDGGSSVEHACGCAGLHAAALLSAVTAAPRPATGQWFVALPAALAAPASSPLALGSPRAPPAG